MSLTDEQIISLRSLVLEMCEEAQKDICVALVDAGKAAVADEQLTFECVLAQLTTVSTSKKLNEESIVEWFNTSLRETFILAFADRLGFSDTPTPEEEKVLAQKVANYQGVLVKLMGKSGRTLEDSVMVQLENNALALIPSDPVSLKLTARIADIRSARREELNAL